MRAINVIGSRRISSTKNKVCVSCDNKHFSIALKTVRFLCLSYNKFSGFKLIIHMIELKGTDVVFLRNTWYNLIAHVTYFFPKSLKTKK